MKPETFTLEIAREPERWMVRVAEVGLTVYGPTRAITLEQAAMLLAVGLENRDDRDFMLRARKALH